MTFDPTVFAARFAAIKAALPAIGELVQIAHAIAPAAPGVAKADVVVQTLLAMEPALEGLNQALHTATSNIVAAHRSAGILP